MQENRFHGSTVNLINLIFIPTVAVLSFFLVAFELNRSLNSAPVIQSKKISVDNINLELNNAPQAPLAPQVMRPMVRERQGHGVASIYLGSVGPSFSHAVSTGNSEVAGLKTESYQSIKRNKVKSVTDEPVSTFSVDVDTGGYSVIRRMLNTGHLPQPERVRTEEMINYFSYDYPSPVSEDNPFSITTEMTVAPWRESSQLLQIGLKGYAEDFETLPASNLVFLVDVSGSMGSDDKLGLAKESLKLLIANLKPEDSVAIVTYAGSTQVVLPSTSGIYKDEIKVAVDRLMSGGGTAGESGMRLAYSEAKAGFIPGGNNRIVMMTDGDFNVGMNSVDEMVRFVEKQRESGVYLSTVGFGQGNYREDMMEQIANHGNGNYSYIDNVNEARRVFERNLRSNLFAIANDVKIQIEFNPELVSEYRLIGYENRLLKTEDFNNDKVDAGEVGQGHTVTALYEITLKGDNPRLDDSKLKLNAESSLVKFRSDELARLKLRYKLNGQKDSNLEQRSVLSSSLNNTPSDNIILAASVASFGELLRESTLLENSFSYSDLLGYIERKSSSNSHEVLELKRLISMASSLANSEK